jgi:hypothetical protein
MPPPDRVWRLYLRRFALDHWYRASEKSSSLDCSCVKYTRSMRSVERAHADRYLAIMAGPSACGTTPIAAGKKLKSNLPLDELLNRLGAF